MLIYKYFLSIDTSKENSLKLFFIDTSKLVEEFILMRQSSSKKFDNVQQFVIEIAWNLAKIDPAVAKEKYGNRNLFAFEEVNGIEMCIETKVQKEASHINTPFEK
jgi:hypothetical protein